ncbi:MAG: FAD-dependent oxidoreductase [Acidimicrobiales bacterium]|nr:FAD-dependent oxidoreductase [Acidimicrobiales bacterium]
MTSNTPNIDEAGVTDHLTDVAVVGSGLAGMVAAVDAARAGAAVTLIEARTAVGGRARSERHDGFVVNQGAHALYRTGAALPILADLGVRWTGRRPRVLGSGWLAGGRRSSMARLAPIGGTRGLAALVRAATSGREVERSRGRNMADWLAEQPERARPALWALIRTATYQADMDGSDAHAILTQFRRGARGVYYLDGGWQTLVDGLAKVVDAEGVRRLEAKASAVRPVDGRWAVDVPGGSVVASSVVLATGGPTDAERLLGDLSPTVSRWARVAEPVKASTLEVLLSAKPKRRPGAYAVDEPVYNVDAAATCRVAPDGGALVHCLFYEPDRHPDLDPRARMEAALDVWQPGWRDRVVDVVERKRMVVAHDRPRLAPAADLPSVVVPDLDGVFLAGDAITTHGLLADAAVSSGREAGRAAARHCAVRPQPDRATTG